MKKLIGSLLVLLILTSISSGQKKHPYASELPLTTPARFNIPGVTNAWHLTFTPEGDTFYFVTGDSIAHMEIIKYCTFENGNWTSPKLASFSGKYRIETPHISPDGKRFFFAKAMVVDNQGIDDIYVMEKTESGWSEPKELGSPVNSPRFDASPSCAANGNLYFFSTRDGKMQIYCSKFINNEYAAPEPLDYTINRNNVGELCIAPDESFILFNIQNPESSHLYVSFRENGSWKLPLDLGLKINHNDYQGRPCISPDGNYLFYTSGSSRDWIMSQYQIDLKPLLDSLRNIIEINYILGSDQINEQPAFIKLKVENIQNINFSETPYWIKPYLKKTDGGLLIFNKINFDGLKEGSYKTHVKISEGVPAIKEHNYSVILNITKPMESLTLKDYPQGLSYGYYEDTSFTTIPDFKNFEPVKSGIANTLDLSLKNRDSLFALVFDGYIEIERTALYTFFLISDDGSKLYFDDSLVINNDGLHAPVELFKTVCLEKGLHKIRIEYTQQGGGAMLELYYEAPDIGIKRRLFPFEDI